MIESEDAHRIVARAGAKLRQLVAILYHEVWIQVVFRYDAEN